MRIPRLYLPGPLNPGAEVPLGAQESHYLSKVLRLQPGHPLVVFDGQGQEYQAELARAHKRVAQVVIGEGGPVSRESPLHSHLAIGISRGERMDWVLQKATELGVSEITPLFTARTEVRLQGERLEKKQAHWRQITISACEQCQRNQLPELHPALTLEQFLLQSSASAGLKLVLHHRSEHSLQSLATPQQVTLLVGPEGGLAEEEIELALGHYQYQPLRLGPRVLRTETAPVAALTAVQLLWGDF